MEVSVENISTLRRLVQVKVPADEVEIRLKDRVSELAQGARIDGFRKGKVPRQLIVQRYGKQLQDEVYRNLLDETLDESLRQEQLQPVALFNLDFERPEKGQDFEYKVSAEVLGELNLTGLENLKVEKPIFSVEATAIDEMLRSYQVHSTNWEAVEGEPQEGDRVSLIVQNLEDGNLEFEKEAATSAGEDAPEESAASAEDDPTDVGSTDEDGTSSEEDSSTTEYPNVFLIVGEPNSWEDEKIEAAVRSMKAGDSIDIRDQEIEEEPASAENEGDAEPKQLAINVKLLQVQRGERPSIAELCEENVLPGETEEEVRDNIRKSEEERLEAQSKALCLQQLEKLLVEHSGIVLPKYSFTSEVLAMRRNLYQILHRRGVSQHLDREEPNIEDVPEDELPELEEERLDRIKMTMAVNFLGAKLVDKYQCRVESTELQNAVQQQLSNYGPNLTQEIVDQVYDEQNIRQMRNGLLLRKAWDAALDEVSSEEVPNSTEELENLRSRYSEITFDVPIDEVEDEPATEQVEAESEIKEGTGKGFLQSIVDRFKKDK